MQSISTRGSKYIALLAKIAEDIVDPAKSRVAAAIVFKNRLIALGVNSKKTDPFQARFSKAPHNIFLHAENSVLKKAKNRLSARDLSNSTLYVVRRKCGQDNSDTGFRNGLAKPCAGCQKTIDEYGIKNVVWTEDE